MDDTSHKHDRYALQSFIMDESNKRRELLSGKGTWCYLAGIVVFLAWAIGRYNGWEFTSADGLVIGIAAALVAIPSISIVLLRFPGGSEVEVQS